MKKLAIVQKLVLFIFLLQLFGCGPIPVTETVEDAAGEKTPQTPPTRTVTAAVVVSSTEPPVPAPTASTTPVVTAANPYSEEEMEWIIQNAPLGYQSCEFPCFLGVQPGVTVFDDVSEIIQRQGFVFFEMIDEKPEIKYYENFGVFSLRLSLKRDPGDGLVQNLTLLVMDSTNQNRDVIKEKWVKYSPERMIAHYGMPDRISIIIPSQQWTGKDEYDYYLVLFFDSLGVRIDYEGREYNKNRQQEICPTWDSLGTSFTLGINDMQSELPLTDIPNMLAHPSYFSPGEELIKDYYGKEAEDLVIKYIFSSEEPCFMLDY